MKLAGDSRPALVGLTWAPHECPKPIIQAYHPANGWGTESWLASLWRAWAFEVGTLWACPECGSVWRVRYWAGWKRPSYLEWEACVSRNAAGQTEEDFIAAASKASSVPLGGSSTT